MPIITKFSETRNQLLKLAITAPATARAIAIELAAECVIAGKRGIIPKDSGNMRSTARVVKEKETIKFVVGGIVGNPSKKGKSAKFVDYAVFVDEGTSRQAPQFFMVRSLARALNKADAIYRQALNSWLNHSR